MGNVTAHTNISEENAATVGKITRTISTILSFQREAIAPRGARPD